MTGLGLLFVLLAPVASTAHAQPAPVTFDRLSIDDGLSSNVVWRILQDRQGFLWIATANGLNRYDGRTFTVFPAGGAGTLRQNNIWALFEDQGGSLWVGTFGGGLSRFDAATQTFTNYLHAPDDPNSLSDDRVRVIYESPHQPDVLWIGTYGGGVNRFDTRTETFTPYRHDPANASSLPNDVVNHIYEDKTGTVWIGTDNGLARMDRREAQPAGSSAQTRPTVSFTNYLPDPSTPRRLPTGAVRAVLEDHTGAFWVGTIDAGLYRMDRATGTFIPFVHNPENPKSLSDDRVTALFEDRDGTLWVGTYGGGLNRFDRATETFDHFRYEPGTPTSLSHNIVRSIYQDRGGGLWVGTYGGGLSKIRKDKFITYRHKPNNPNSLISTTVNTVVEDHAGGLWVGTLNRGLTHIAGFGGAEPVYRHYQPDPRDPNSLSDAHVTEIHASRQEPGVIWVGTSGGGFDRFDSRTSRFTRYRFDADTPGSSSSSFDLIQAIHESYCEPGVLWVGASSGLYRFDVERETVTRVFPTRDGGEIRSDAFAELFTIHESPDAPCELWITARYQDLLKLTASTPETPTARGSAKVYDLTHYRYSSEAPFSNETLHFRQAADGTMWLAENADLVSFDPVTETYREYTVDDVFRENLVTIRSLLPDEEGHLWIATSNGLFRMDPENETLRRYDVNDGLQGNEFRLWSAFKGREGVLYFGGTQGLSVIRPDRIEENAHLPPIVFTDFRLFNKSVPIRPDGSDGAVVLRRSISETARLVLPHDANVLSFDFAALDYVAPSKNEYAYWLEGFNEDWIYSGTEATATYTNLDPGDYVLRVKGSNNDGVWNEEGAALAITILPPWYQTWWFYGLVGVFFAFVGPSIYVLRVRQLKAREAELEQVVEERTAELQRANALKSRFLANISHEFRTPLTLTFGPIDDLLADRFNSVEESKPHFKRARRNGARLLRLINQLLDLSRLDAGVLLLYTRRLDLAGHLRQIAAMFESMANTQGLHLAAKIPEEPFPYVFDPDKLEKVVINLLSNAFKFTPRGGKVSLTLAREADGAARIVVADTGPGIAEEHLPRLFDRFYQVEGSSTRKHEGSGIGLSLVKELVALHEGRIEVESTVGFGTRFTIILPVLVAEEVALPEQAVAPPTEPLEVAPLETPSEPATHVPAPEAVSDEATVVLLVEDNADMRAYIRSHLEASFTIVEADNGRTGLEQAQELVPDLVLSDVMMPEMDGLELCQALKTDTTTSHIPVVLLTAKAAVEHRIAGFESGADAYLPKPFNAEELQVRVRTLIDERRRLRARFAGARGAEAPAVDSDATEDAAPPAALPPREAAFLEQVDGRIAARLGDTQFGVDELAEAVAMSPRQLLRKLRALTGEATTALIRRRRLEQAASLLGTGTVSVKEVTFTVGFSNESSFGRAFRQHYGMAPSAYAEQAQQG